jgi:hypothetical protein
MHRYRQAGSQQVLKVRAQSAPDSQKRSAFALGLRTTLGVIHMSVRYFFDVPVYRLLEDRYYREREAHIDRVMYPPALPHSAAQRAKDMADPSRSTGFRDHLERSYGGCWRFNEVVGYIRLHFLGSQVRGEYYGLNRKRVVRTRTRTLEYRTWKLAPEVDISFPITSKRVRHAISQYLEACRTELPGRHIDTELFEAMAKHVNWRKLFLAP